MNGCTTWYPKWRNNSTGSIGHIDSGIASDFAIAYSSWELLDSKICKPRTSQKLRMLTSASWKSRGPSSSPNTTWTLKKIRLFWKRTTIEDSFWCLHLPSNLIPVRSSGGTRDYLDILHRPHSALNMGYLPAFSKSFLLAPHDSGPIKQANPMYHAFGWNIDVILHRPQSTMPQLPVKQANTSFTTRNLSSSTKP